MSQVKILVCTHKEGFVKSDDIFMPIQGGKAISKVNLGIQGDDTGDNISEQNPYYCELTVLYWAWKNLKNIDYIGLCHYRRYFLFSPLPFQVIKICPSEACFSQEMTDFNLAKHLGTYDLILSKPLAFHYPIMVYYCLLHYIEDYNVVKETIKTSFSDYYDAFCYVMENNNKLFSFNIFITKWEIFDDYCRWLFAILEKIEPLIDFRNRNVSQARALAYIGELLLSVYVLKNKLKYKSYPLISFDSTVTGGNSFSKGLAHCISTKLSFLISRPLRSWQIKY
jgi:hypothetical protein